MSEPIYELDIDLDFVNHLVDPDAFAVIKAECLKPDLIVDEYVREIYRWQNEHYREHGQIATASALEASFDDAAISAPLTAIGDLIQRMRERHLHNAGRIAIKRVAEAYKHDHLTVASELMREGRELSALTSRKGEAWGSGDHERSMLEYHKNVLKGPGPSLGFKELDEYFFGQRGLTFILGAPKSMKSWMCINAVLQNVIEGKTVWLDSLELPAYEANMRLRCMAADVPWWKFIKGRLDKSDFAKLAEAGDYLDSLGTFRVVSPPIGDRDTKTLVQQAVDAGADVLFIDQLQYLQDSNGTRLGDGNTTGAYWGVGDDLREFSKQIPITVLHQFNRSVMNADEMPQVQQAKGSSMVEEVGTLVLGLWANKDMRHSNIMQIGTLASRNYGLPAWEIKVEMNKGCGFEIIGTVDDKAA